MSPICSQLTQLYQAWSDSLANMTVARLRYQKSGAVIDKQAFDEALASAKASQRTYNHEAYDILVEYRDLQICQLEALIVQGINTRLITHGKNELRPYVNGGRVVRLAFPAHTSSSLDSFSRLFFYLKALRGFSCQGLHITRLPELPAWLTTLDCSDSFISFIKELPVSLTRFRCDHNLALKELPKLPNSLAHLECSYTALKELPKLPNSLTYLECLYSNITELPDLPDSLIYIDIRHTPAAKDPKVQEKLKAFQEAHPGTTVLF